MLTTVKFWTGPDPGAENSIQVSQMGSRNSIFLAITTVCRKLEATARASTTPGALVRNANALTTKLNASFLSFKLNH